jgi:ribosome maturation factor RimP
LKERASKTGGAREEFKKGNEFKEMANGPNSQLSPIEALVAPKVRSLGYDLLDLEYQARSPQGGPVLRLFIENPEGKPISFEDCAAVDHGLDALFESPEFDAVVPDTFTLEVSSPGLDRPLKKPSDFLKYEGRKAQIKTYRPLTEAELGNSKYFEHHQKQKNFFGILKGYAGDSVELEADNERIKIPFALITKANLDVASQLSVDDAKAQP